MKARPKRLLPSRLKKIDSLIRLSKNGKRIQDMQFWEEAAIDLLGYVSYLQTETERMGKNIAEAQDNTNYAIRETEDDLNDRNDKNQREWYGRESKFKRQAQQLQLENSRLKIALLKYEKDRK